MVKRSAEFLNVGSLPTYEPVSRQCRFEDCHRDQLEDLGLQVCPSHLTQMITSLRELADHVPVGPPKTMTEQAALSISMMFQPRTERGNRHHPKWPKGPVVYYVRLGHYIKIGFTGRFGSRLSALTISQPDYDVLALEMDGSYELEAQRHKQFASHRLNNSELFTPHDALTKQGPVVINVAK